MDTTTTAIVAEKPSVARDIARVVGATKQGDGFLHGNGHVVTWAIGHLVSLAQPHEMRPEWKSWRRDLLPILPQEWPLVVYDRTKPQFETVKRILTSEKIARVICATDAGRECRDKASATKSGADVRATMTASAMSGGRQIPNFSAVDRSSGKAG